jgi:hypothetical protein
MVFDPSCALGRAGLAGATAIRGETRISAISGDRNEQEKHHFLIILLSFLER